MSNNPTGSDVTVFKAYEFGPDGTVFSTSITIKIRYDLNSLSLNYDQDDLSLFLYENNNWNEILNSKFKHNYIQGEISHFSKIGIGVFTDYENLEESDERNEDEEENNSASISFEVPVEVHHWTDYYVDKDGEIHEDASNFVSAAYIHWEPQPYARYYEFSLNFNGNDPAPNSFPSSCDWSKRNLNYCGYNNYYYKEGETYYLCVDESCGIENINNYQGLCYNFDKFEIDFIGEHHGRYIGGIQECLPVDPAVQLEMETFTEEYFNGWTATIRAVS